MKESNFLSEVLNQFETGQTTVIDFLINISITILLSYLLGLVYSKYGNSLSNRKKLTQTFVLIALTVMLVITIVKSSLALSLGLVGALSIVRFRTAIKEPEELVYFFIAIAIGLGLGADQKLVTIAGALIMMAFIYIQNKKAINSIMQQNLIVCISNTNDRGFDENKVLEIVKDSCAKVELKRLDQGNDNTEISLNVEFQSVEDILKVKRSLSEQNDIKFSFVETY